jgi:hypothetical protein
MATRLSTATSPRRLRRQPVGLGRAPSWSARRWVSRHGHRRARRRTPGEHRSRCRRSRRSGAGRQGSHRNHQAGTARRPGAPEQRGRRRTRCGEVDTVVRRTLPASCPPLISAQSTRALVATSGCCWQQRASTTWSMLPWSSWPRTVTKYSPASPRARRAGHRRRPARGADPSLIPRRPHSTPIGSRWPNPGPTRAAFSVQLGQHRSAVRNGLGWSRGPIHNGTFRTRPWLFGPEQYGAPLDPLTAHRSAAPLRTAVRRPGPRSTLSLRGRVHLAAHSRAPVRGHRRALERAQSRRSRPRPTTRLARWGRCWGARVGQLERLVA